MPARSVLTTNRADLLRLAVQMAELRERIGRRMRELREERQHDDPKWTQEYVARLVDPMLSGTQVSRWERGEHRPEDERLERIAAIYETSVADLYAGPMADRTEPKAGVLDALSSQNGESEIAEVHRKLDQILDQQAELLAMASEVRDEQERLRRLQEPDEHGREATGS
jgi:transcriptional regulator with XRE-family HTH domain